MRVYVTYSAIFDSVLVRDLYEEVSVIVPKNISDELRTLLKAGHGPEFELDTVDGAFTVKEIHDG